MKLTVKRDVLLGPLQLVTSVVERRHTQPVMANVLLVLSGDTLFLTGSDLVVEIMGRLPVEQVISPSPAEITVPAKKLVDICRSLPEGADIEIALDDDQRICIKSGRSRFTLSTLPAVDFPAIEIDPGELSFTCEQRLIKRLLDRTLFCMAQQDVRFYLNGVLWEVDGDQLRCVATDGHRLAMCTKSLDIQVPSKIQAILPRKGVVELSRLLSDDEHAFVAITLTDHHMKIETEAYTLISKLVDAKFPDYERVLPRGGTNVVLGDRSQLKQAFSRAAILSNEKYRGVCLHFKPGLLTIVANNPDQEEAEEQVTIDYQGDEIEMGFNVSYLQDVSNVLASNHIKITLIDADNSALIEEPEEGGDSAYVIMPMML